MAIGRQKVTTAQRIQGTAAEIGELRATLPEIDDKWQEAVRCADQSAENDARAEREAALRAISDLEARLPVLREQRRADLVEAYRAEGQRAAVAGERARDAAQERLSAAVNALEAADTALVQVADELPGHWRSAAAPASQAGIPQDAPDTDGIGELVERVRAGLKRLETVRSQFRDAADWLERRACGGESWIASNAERQEAREWAEIAAAHRCEVEVDAEAERPPAVQRQQADLRPPPAARVHQIITPAGRIEPAPRPRQRLRQVVGADGMVESNYELIDGDQEERRDVRVRLTRDGEGPGAA